MKTFVMLSVRQGSEWYTRTVKQEDTVWGSTRSQFLWDEMDF